jgi:hypothetical protein
MAQQYDFSGVWRSSYRYNKQNPRPVGDTEHYVTMYQKGNQLIAESLPNTEGSYLLARFTLDGRIATGSYQSQNSPRSSAKGAIYYGAAQLVLDHDGKALRGKGVGFGKDMEIKVTDWELVHIGQRASAQMAAKVSKPTKKTASSPKVATGK